ncbi:hypothetical protein H072_5364 [Dactylellina haptotyla CBS 200.50]|uniref:BHLH domain-containing protein n=1 Tax=Dactylellina haptotyla (strain CBS 200.50) TaxID=1284197 RepID=S8BMK6_DACHA|nr:hypothetical protein H072_5364 [Dactylellina haptotyla CBS 200.50]
MENTQHFIKDEHGDQQNGRFVHNDFSGFGAPTGFAIDPSELSMGQQGGLMFSNNNNNMQQFNSSAITDDELLDSLGTSYGFQGGHMGAGFNANDMDNLPSGLQGQSLHLTTNMNQMYSHTPEDAPIQSPFVRGFPQFRHHMQNQPMDSPSSFNPSPGIMSSSADVHASSFGDMMNAKNKRKTRPDIERAGSSKNSVPRNIRQGSLSLNTTESGMQAQPIQNPHLSRHGHQKSLSGTWDGSSSYIESPMSSPGPGSAGHRQISDILGGKHASLPAKVDGMSPSQQSQEAKRRRRRESHNLVERRRRDNINERIQELSFLVPQHRLEDEKVRKHLQNNTPLSPGLHGVSPPRATSMLAGGLGRRASGVGPAAITIPLEEKDRVPNKGDILNGAVGWTKDLMWALYHMLKQEKEMQQKLESLGQPFPINKNEEMKRMESELIAAIENNSTEPFRYSRGHGSGLRVPGYTDLAGAPTNGQGEPGSLPVSNQQFWHNTGSADMSGSLAFKEEDEFGMDVS